MPLDLAHQLANLTTTAAGAMVPTPGTATDGAVGRSLFRVA
jgi:hypothetical protein